MRDEYEVHERIRRALGRVRLAVARGNTPTATDTTSVLGSCGCGQCRAQVRALAVELAPLFADAEADQ